MVGPRKVGERADQGEILKEVGFLLGTEWKHSEKRVRILQSGSKETEGHFRLLFEEAANGRGPAKSAAGLMQKEALGWLPSHLVLPISHLDLF